MRLATLKHINSKNADYGAAEQYLLFEHDEFTMKPVLDETGRLIPVSYTHLSAANTVIDDASIRHSDIKRAKIFLTLCFITIPPFL